MAAITWKNIDTPSIGDASRAMAYAGQSLNGGFDVLKEALKSYQTGQEAIYKKEDAAATQDVLGKIYQARNVDDFNALDRSGALDQVVAANGATIDRAAVNALRDGRADTMRTRELNGLKFGEEKLGYEQAAATAEGMAIAQRQDPVAFQAWQEAHPDNRKLADILGLNRKVGQENTKFDQGTEKHKSDLLTAEDTRTTNAAHRKLFNAQVGLANAQASAATLRAEDAVLDTGRGGSGSGTGTGVASTGSKALDRVIAQSPYSSGSVDTKEGRALLLAGMKSLGMGTSQQQDVLDNLEKYYKSGAIVGLADKDDKAAGIKKGDKIYAPLPVDVVLQELGSGGNSDYLSFFGLNSRVGDVLVNRLDKRFGVKGDNNLFSSTGTHTVTDESQMTADKALLQDMYAINGLRNQQARPLLNPGPPTVAESQRQALVAAARRNTEERIPKK